MTLEAQNEVRYAEVNLRYLVGVYRDMWMEWLDSRGIKNANHLTIGSPANWPRSIYHMRNVIEDAGGMDYHQFWLADILQQYNDGRRA